MSLLVDRDILDLRNRFGLVTGLTEPKDWFTKDSPIQASSLDLHVGEIYLPMTDDSQAQPTPLQEHILKAGETAVVTTAEVLKLPTNVGAFGFPPTQVSGKAVLMTNPGHVDPGFNGRMRFTLINMGRQLFPIRHGDLIATLLLVQTTRDPQADYASRDPHLPHSNGPTADSLRRLGKDFLDFTKQAETIAQGVVDKEKVRADSADRVLKAWLAVVTLVTLVVPFTAQCFGSVKDLTDRVRVLDSDVRQSSARVTALEGTMNVALAQRRIDSAMARLSTLDSLVMKVNKICTALRRC